MSDERARLLRPVLVTAVGALGLGAGGTSSALLGRSLTSSTAAGVPLSVLVIGSALAAPLISRASARHGRTRSLAFGYAAGAVGAVLAIGAAETRSFAVLLVGSVLLGGANAAIFLTRYAAAEQAGPHARARALGTVLAATAVGAIISPNLLGPSGSLMATLGFARLSGLYSVAFVAFGIAAIVLASTSAERPSPPVSHTAAEGGTLRQRTRMARELIDATRNRQVRLATIVLGTGNMAMVAIMTVTPMDMTGHGQTLDLVGVIISVHVAAMFLPSLLTGWVADRLGAVTVAVCGLVLLGCTGVTGTLADTDPPVVMTAVLAMLGLSWNCCVVGGSTLLAAAVTPSVRADVEGIGESVMGLAAAIGAPLASVMLAGAGLGSLWALTVLVALATLTVARGRRSSTSPVRYPSMNPDPCWQRRPGR